MLRVALLCLLVVSATWAKSTEVDPSENQIDKDDGDNVKEGAGGYDRAVEDPCYTHQCAVGQECDLDEDNKPVCICARSCTPETQDRAKVNVCSTSNVTFESECEMYRQKCLCSHAGRRGCDNAEYADNELNYYGPCKDLGECKEFEKTEYPRRMREWLYLIMEELDSRKELPSKASKMAKKALKMEKKWVIPVVWKFCDLDTNPDEEIDFHELIPISAPLKPLEHCTEEFLDDCDGNDDGVISKREWGMCLGLDEEDMEQRCEDYRDEE
jgi:hypothetical protein